MKYEGFEWDDDKAESNKKDHGVSFEEAQEVFSFDDNRVELVDEIHSEEEHRYYVIGFSREGRPLLVTFTERGQNIRIIGARIAETKWQRIYEENGSIRISP